MALAGFVRFLAAAQLMLLCAATSGDSDGGIVRIPRLLPHGLSVCASMLDVPSDETRQPDCKKKLNDVNKCEKEDANNRCRAMSDTWTCLEDVTGFSHYNDGDSSTTGWDPDDCYCVWG
jgi:hypothetical protein